jgi:hypothetical protein
MLNSIGEKGVIIEEHEVIRCTMSPSSFRFVILQLNKVPLILSPPTIKPPPKKSDFRVNEIPFLFFKNTLLHFDASVAQAPPKSNAFAEKQKSTRIALKPTRVSMLNEAISAILEPTPERELNEAPAAR